MTNHNIETLRSQQLLQRPARTPYGWQIAQMRQPNRIESIIEVGENDGAYAAPVRRETCIAGEAPASLLGGKPEQLDLVGANRPEGGLRLRRGWSAHRRAIRATIAAAKRQWAACAQY